MVVSWNGKSPRCHQLVSIVISWPWSNPLDEKRVPWRALLWMIPSPLLRCSLRTGKSFAAASPALQRNMCRIPALLRKPSRNWRYECLANVPPNLSLGDSRWLRVTSYSWKHVEVLFLHVFFSSFTKKQWFIINLPGRYHVYLEPQVSVQETFIKAYQGGSEAPKVWLHMKGFKAQERNVLQPSLDGALVGLAEYKKYANITLTRIVLYIYRLKIVKL